MKNADMPANPIFDVEAKPYIVRDSETGNTETASGLTKREMISMYAMQGLCSACDDNGVWNHDEKVVAEVAVAYADALLEELAK